MGNVAPASEDFCCHWHEDHTLLFANSARFCNLTEFRLFSCKTATFCRRIQDLLRKRGRNYKVEDACLAELPAPHRDIARSPPRSWHQATAFFDRVQGPSTGCEVKDVAL